MTAFFLLFSFAPLSSICFFCFFFCLPVPLCPLPDILPPHSCALFLFVFLLCLPESRPPLSVLRCVILLVARSHFFSVFFFFAVSFALFCLSASFFGVVSLDIIAFLLPRLSRTSGSLLRLARLRRSDGSLLALLSAPIFCFVYRSS